MSDLTALALNAADTLSIAEIHGVVCGLSVWQPESFDYQELIDLVGADALTDAFSVEAFVNATIDGLRDEEMSFAPLLGEGEETGEESGSAQADDEADLRQRLEGIAEWSAGFLAGFAAAGSARGLDSLDTLGEEVQEIVGDLSAITDIDVEEFAAGGDEPVGEDGHASAEADFMQIYEFVKVGVLLILNLMPHTPPGEPGGTDR